MSDVESNDVEPADPANQLGSMIVERLLSGDFRTLSRCISAIENGDPATPQIVDRLRIHAGRAAVIGVTGVPGGGKSTLVSLLAQRLAVAGARPAILAVDPSSPISGGALLGDRIRNGSDPKAVFFRSLASRGSLGGLSQAIDDAVTVLDAAGRDFIFIETVGTGQSEIGVTQVAHTTVLVTAPGLGDEIQAMKAGITEFAHLQLVNKGDVDPAGAEATALTLRHRLADSAGNARLSEGANAATANSPPAWLPPVRVVSAQSGAGIEGLLGFMRAHRIFLESAGGLVSWQRHRVIARYHQAIREVLHARLSCEWRQRLEHDEAAVADGLMMPASAAQRFVRDALVAPPMSPKRKDLQP